MIVQDSTTSTRETVETATNATVGSWENITGMYNGSDSLCLYVNGKFVARTNPTATLAITPFSKFWYLGTNAPQHDGGSDRSLEGIVDEVKVYNRALSPLEIFDNTWEVSTTAISGLVAYWDFETGNGNTITDRVGSYNGTLDMNTWKTDLPFSADVMAQQYKASVGVTSSSGKVNAWADQSGNSVNLSQTTGALQPTILGGAIVFDGSNTENMVTSRETYKYFTVFVVGSISDFSSAGTWFGDSLDASNLIRYSNATASLARGNQDNTVTLNHNQALETDTYYLFTFLFDTTNATIYIDGTQQGTNTDGNFNYTLSQVGYRFNTDALNAAVKEMRVYDYPMCETEQNYVENLLGDLYNIAGLGFGGKETDRDFGYKSRKTFLKRKAH
jgi:hypothetical protein